MKIGLVCEKGWSIEAVYEGLGKELHKHGIDTHIIHIEKYRDLAEQTTWTKISNNFDYFFMPTGPCFMNLYNEMFIPNEKCIPMIHAPWEIEHMVETYGENCFDRYPLVISVSKRMSQYAKYLKVKKKFAVVQNGVLFDRFYQKISNNLVNVGYAYPLFTHHKWKRTHLAGKIDNGVTILPSLIPFYAMGQFYKKIDASLMFSTKMEACGLIIAESAAAGKLVISSDVGILEELPESPVVRVRIGDDEIVEDMNNVIREYKNDSDKYKLKCMQIQEFAREFYDWEYAIKSWLKAINSLNHSTS